MIHSTNSNYKPKFDLIIVHIFCPFFVVLLNCYFQEYNLFVTSQFDFHFVLSTRALIEDIKNLKWNVKKGDPWNFLPHERKPLDTFHVMSYFVSLLFVNLIQSAVQGLHWTYYAHMYDYCMHCEMAPASTDHRCDRAPQPQASDASERDRPPCTISVIANPFKSSMCLLYVNKTNETVEINCKKPTRVAGIKNATR